MKGFEATIDGTTATLKVSGPIDKTCEFPTTVKCEKLIIDFEKLTVFNSYGIRLWIIWSKALTVKTVELVNCRPTFIKQTQHIPDLIPPSAHVKSFYVPYFDVDADKGVEVKLEAGKDFTEAGLTLSAPPTNAAGKPLELDVVADKYFAFLKR